MLLVRNSKTRKKGAIDMSGNRILINVMEKKKGSREIANCEYHDSRGFGTAEPTGTQVLQFRKYNADVVNPVKNFNKYIKEHAHIGYKAYEEIKDFENDFVIPRLTKDTIKMDTLTVCPGFHIPPTEEAIKAFYASADYAYFEDYIVMFQKMHPDIKILSATVHVDEVFFPRCEYDEQGKWVRDLSKEETIERAYIPVHMHISYIPLKKETAKDGTEYLKLNHNAIWGGSGCKYWQTFREFNDKCFEILGNIYNVARGTVWQDWKDRTVSGEECVKKQRKLNEYKLAQEQARLDGLLQKAQTEQEEELAFITSKTESAQELLDALQAELKKKQLETVRYIKKLDKKIQLVQQKENTANAKIRLFYDIELMLQKHQISMELAKKAIQQNGLEQDLLTFSFEDGKESTPELHNLASMLYDDENAETR